MQNFAQKKIGWWELMFKELWSKQHYEFLKKILFKVTKGQEEHIE
jgi:hypothetical protein